MCLTTISHASTNCDRKHKDTITTRAPLYCNPYIMKLDDNRIGIYSNTNIPSVIIYVYDSSNMLLYYGNIDLLYKWEIKALDYLFFENNEYTIRMIHQNKIEYYKISF